jgi:hypothetical protein
MNAPNKRVLVVHDEGGLPLAILAVEERAVGNGLRAGYKPVLQKGQLVAEIELAPELQQVGLHELLQFRVTYSDQKATLRK